jgi:hypothetical protein
LNYQSAGASNALHPLCAEIQCASAFGPLPADTLRGCHVHRRAIVLAGGIDDLRFGKAMGRGSLAMSEGYKSIAEGYAASLRQMADGNFVDFDELRGAAEYLDGLTAELNRLRDIEWMYTDLCK